jgi:hypothetical protein
MSFQLSSKIAIEISKWNCPVCSFENNDHYYYCEMCGYEDTVYHLINTNTEYNFENKKIKAMHIFPKKTIMPVLSCNNIEHFQQNITLLVMHCYNKIGGIWLSCSNCSVDVIKQTYTWIKNVYPSLWVGINLVGETIIKMLEFIQEFKPDGIWSDRSYITDEEIQNIPKIIIDSFKRSNWNGLYFGGTLFKYVKQDGDVNKILENSIKYMDVLTTSGNGTGIEINKEKIEKIYNQVSEKILVAIASGITSDNILRLSKTCDIFIVGTSITDKNSNIIINKLTELYNALNA